MWRVVLIILTILVITTKSQDFEWDPIDQRLCKTPDDKNGFCISVQFCQHMLDAVDNLPKPIPEDAKNHLQKYQCFGRDASPKVCCPSEPIILNLGEKLESPDVSNHENLKLLPENCGIFNEEDKIIGGSKTHLFEFPWMALLSYQSRSGPQFRCGGTIINEKYILTAAHCLANPTTKLLGVRVGEFNIKTLEDCEFDDWTGKICSPPHQDLQIEEIIVHPNYDHKIHTNDIALVRVTPIHFQENIQPVCLPLHEARTANLTNRWGVVVGWGATEIGRPSPQLLKVSLPVLSFPECQKKYERLSKLNERQFCAGGTKGKDSCGGDSGGPLHLIGRVKGEVRQVQQGIVSFGPVACGQVDIPGVYTGVAFFMDWILDNLKP